MNIKRRIALDKLEDIIREYEKDENGTNNLKYYATTKEDVVETLREVVHEITESLSIDDKIEEAEMVIAKHGGIVEW